MGAWGSGIFENDDACDYAAGIAESGGAAALERTLDKVLAIGSDYVEAADGAEALAAADIVARMMGRGGRKTAYTELMDKWVEKATKPSTALIDKARRAVGRVLTEPSELMELWQDSEDFAVWKSSLDDISARLKP